MTSVAFGRSLRSVCSCLPLLSLGTATIISPAQAIDTSTLLGDRAEVLEPPSLLADSATPSANTHQFAALAEQPNTLGLTEQSQLLAGISQAAWQKTVLAQASFSSPTATSSSVLSSASPLKRLSDTSEPTFRFVDRRSNTDSLATLVTQVTTTVMASLSLDAPLSVGGSLEQTTVDIAPETRIPEADVEGSSTQVAFLPPQPANLPQVTAMASPVPFGRAADRQRRTVPSLTAAHSMPLASVIQPQPRVASRPQTTPVAPVAAVPPIAPPVPVQVARSIVTPPLPSHLDLPPLPAADRFLPSLTTNFIWPARGVVTSGFGPRWGRMHRGIDIAAPIGTPIYAAAAGVVTYSQWNSGGFGNLVEIRHADGTLTLYAHNHRNLVRVGQYVQQGEQIAEMGSTGRSTGPHVHFEIHPQGRGAVDPMIFLRRAQS